jgi:hypothetical protein
MILIRIEGGEPGHEKILVENDFLEQTQNLGVEHAVSEDIDFSTLMLANSGVILVLQDLALQKVVINIINNVVKLDTRLLLLTNYSLRTNNRQ